ncbi:RNA-dependent RNA polymerase [Changjiang narna-like virus 1]|uniref:RNA-dependent RNA polymerase n=1 Tax=Changjiang narna-like virus 1 TaxID=1922776 RepID=UPI000909AFDC|nr:RNA-dependent RNA polymerase [Changjiang narna-like virus 1]APG77110.1 RNA-dependent RNA polymerase [Changjiang narna-like virus 1]
MMTESEPLMCPDSSSLSAPIGFAAALPKKAAAVLTIENIESWRRLTSASLPTAGAPSWHPLVVVDSQQEILSHSEALGPPLDLPLIDCFIKASHMIHWYNNTVEIWAHSLISGDYGESLVNKGCILRSCLSTPTCSRMLGRWTALAQFGKLEAYLKWVTANFFAESLLQKELPPPPDVFKGILAKIPGMKRPYPGRSWSSLFSRTHSVKSGLKWRFTFGKDFYMTKNASLPVEESFVQANLEKHQKILCGQIEDKLSEATYDEVCEAIQLCADEIFGKPYEVPSKFISSDLEITENIRSFSRPEIKCPSRLPSFGASFHGNRGDGGACGDLLRNYHDIGSLPEPNDGYLWGYAQKNGSELCEVRTLHDPELFFEAEKQWSREALFLSSEGVNAHVVPLIEPFKVRTITKGQAEIYHLARRWQKIIHSRMRQHPNFKLIGQPCNGAFISQIFGNSKLFNYYGDKNGFFVSGDYESATDLLNPALSEFAQEQISIRLGIPLEDQYVLKQCLTGHRLRYEKEGQLFEQTWGQLMGSPTSFPVLCLVNMAATLLSYNRAYKSSFRLSDLPTCVNGDDVLFWARDGAHYEIWKQITGECGLKFSLGKNYTSRHVCVINSELYRFVKDTDCQIHRPSPLFRLEKALNSRLLCGGTRSAASSGFDPLMLSDIDLSIYSSAVGGSAAFRRLVKSHLRPHQGVEPSPKKVLAALRKRYRNGGFSEDYAKWFNTIPSRALGLLEQHDGEIETDLVVRPKMREFMTKVFNDLQISKLHKFARADSRVVKNSPGFYKPQHLGGLGLIPPINHVFSIHDHLEIASLRALPAEAHQFSQGMTPKMASVSFMESVRAEILEIQDTLEIERALLPAADIESLRFNGEESQFWDQEFLVGFVDPENVVVDSESRSRKESDLNKILTSRNWKSRRLTGEMRRQAALLEKASGVKCEKTFTDASHGHRLRYLGAMPQGKETVNLIEGDWHLISRRPLPKFH